MRHPTNPNPYSTRLKSWLHWYLGRLVHMGIIPRAGRCQQCASDKPLDMHHPNYYHPLQIVWLCRRCHTREHSDRWLRNLEEYPHDIMRLARLDTEDRIGTAREWDAEDIEQARNRLVRIHEGTRKLSGTFRSQYF